MRKLGKNHYTSFIARGKLSNGLFIFAAVLTALFSLLLAGQYTGGSAYICLAENPVTSPDYLRVINDVTPIYKDEELKEPLFFLPYTYYVKVCAFNGDVCLVEVYGNSDSVSIDGFVKTDDLFYDGAEVKNPFAEVFVCLNDDTVFYKDRYLSVGDKYVFKGRTAYFYGYTEKGDLCVCYNSALYYIPSSSVYPFTVPAHGNPLTFLPSQTEETETTESQPENSDLPLRLIILLSLMLAGVISLVAVAVKRKTPQKAAAGYYDENDYE